MWPALCPSPVRLHAALGAVLAMGCAPNPGAHAPDSRPDTDDPAPCVATQEVAYDGVDQDCDGTDLEDVDADGQTATEVGGTDCADTDPLVYLGASEIPYDGVDQDCDGADLVDVDGDGFASTAAEGEDCVDDDGTVHPDAVDVPYDGIDQDCTGADQVDVDGDGWPAHEAGGEDCADEDAQIHPGQPEACDGVDNDCDGRVDAQVAGGNQDTIQAALDAACAEGDTVWVMAGTWTEQIEFPPWNVSLVSVDGADTTIIDGTSCQSTGNRCTMVRVTHGNDETSLIEGFTIRNGLGYQGGGMYVGQSGITIRDVVFDANTAEAEGGGLYLVEQSSVVIEGASFIGNWARSRGGGIWAPHARSLAVYSSAFTGNLAGTGGGGAILFHTLGDESIVEGSTFVDNHTTGYGGAIYCSSGGGKDRIQNNSFSNNTAEYWGGAVHCTGLWTDEGDTNTYSGNVPDDLAP